MKAFLYRACAIIFSHFVLYPDYRISFFIPLAFRFADYKYAVALFIILLVPSLNLCGLSNSRMQQRITELGVRKAFGGTKSVLVRQILNENLMLTLLGGVVGLLFSYLAVYAMRMWLFTNNQNVGTSGEFSLNMEALFSPWVFLLAFVFCVVINLLSAALPAWIAARRTIVDSLNDK